MEKIILCSSRVGHLILKYPVHLQMCVCKPSLFVDVYVCVWVVKRNRWETAVITLMGSSVCVPHPSLPLVLSLPLSLSQSSLQSMCISPSHLPSFPATFRLWRVSLSLSLFLIMSQNCSLASGDESKAACVWFYLRVGVLLLFMANNACNGKEKKSPALKHDQKQIQPLWSCWWFGILLK